MDGPCCRVLAVASPALGHLFPMVPTLWALRAAGHDVRVAVPGYFAPAVLQTGLAASVCTEPASEDVAVCGSDRVAASDRDGTAAEATHRRFARLSLAMGPEVEALAAGWRPDVILSDPVDLAGRRVATMLGIPFVEHRWGPAPAEAPRTAAARGVFGDESATWPGTGGGAPDLTVDPCPPSLRTPGTEPGEAVRYVPFNGPALAPRWSTEPPASGTRVMITLGTVVSDGDDGRGTILSAAVAAARRAGAEVVVAADRRRVATAVVEGARAVGWLPVGLVAPTCALVVHHGGSGTMLSSFAAGVAQVACPSAFDEVHNARRIDELGAGRLVAVAGEQVEVVLEDAIRSLLTDPSFCERAAAVQEEIAGAPPPAEAALAIVGPTRRGRSRPAAATERRGGARWVSGPT